MVWFCIVWFLGQANGDAEGYAFCPCNGCNNRTRGYCYVFFKDLRLLLCSFLFFFKENYLLSFLLWELLLISYCFSCVLFRCFFFHKKNYLLSFLLQELLLIYCNNMITRAVLKNKGLIFIYFFLIFLSNFLWYDFDFVCFCGGFRGGEKV